MWMPETQATEGDVPARLAQLGAEIEMDDEGEVRLIRFSGDQYNDSIVELLAKLVDVEVLDVRETCLTMEGVKALRELLPTTTIIF